MRRTCGSEQLDGGAMAWCCSGSEDAALDPPWIEAQEEGRRRGAACSSSRERVALGVGHEQRSSNKEVTGWIGRRVWMRQR